MAITIRQNCKNFNYTIVTKDTWVNLTTALSLDEYKRNYIFISNGGVGWSYVTTPIVEVWTDISIVPVAQHGQPVFVGNWFEEHLDQQVPIYVQSDTDNTELFVLVAEDLEAAMHYQQNI